MTSQVLPKASLPIFSLLYHAPLVPGAWATCHFLNIPVPTSFLHSFL